MAVTKLQPAAAVEAALAAGVTLFGENRLDEVAEKQASFRGAELHLIGHLQRNKVRQAAELVTCVESIDKIETAEALARRCAVLGRRMGILLELNTSGAPTQSGFRSREELLAALEGILALEALQVRGLMTIAPISEEPERIRAAFRSTRSLFEELRERYPALGIELLSMGMSGDFELAVEEGSTLVRIGSALFGSRSAT